MSHELVRSFINNNRDNLLSFFDDNLYLKSNYEVHNTNNFSFFLYYLMMDEVDLNIFRDVLAKHFKLFNSSLFCVQSRFIDKLSIPDKNDYIYDNMNNVFFTYDDSSKSFFVNKDKLDYYMEIFFCYKYIKDENGKADFILHNLKIVSPFLRLLNEDITLFDKYYQIIKKTNIEECKYNNNNINLDKIILNYLSSSVDFSTYTINSYPIGFYSKDIVNQLLTYIKTSSLNEYLLFIFDSSNSNRGALYNFDKMYTIEKLHNLNNNFFYNDFHIFYNKNLHYFKNKMYGKRFSIINDLIETLPIFNKNDIEPIFKNVIDKIVNDNIFENLSIEEEFNVLIWGAYYMNNQHKIINLNNEELNILKNISNFEYIYKINKNRKKPYLLLNESNIIELYDYIEIIKEKKILNNNINFKKNKNIKKM